MPDRPSLGPEAAAAPNRAGRFAIIFVIGRWGFRPGDGASGIAVVAVDLDVGLI